jgi:hypothetical protein
VSGDPSKWLKADKFTSIELTMKKALITAVIGLQSGVRYAVKIA